MDKKNDNCYENSAKKNDISVLLRYRYIIAQLPSGQRNTMDVITKAFNRTLARCFSACFMTIKKIICIYLINLFL